MSIELIKNGKSLQQLAKECEGEMFKEEIKEIYENYNKQGKSFGAFCHR